jgi:hypothetical protein
LGKEREKGRLTGRPERLVTKASEAAGSQVAAAAMLRMVW